MPLRRVPRRLCVAQGARPRLSCFSAHGGRRPTPCIDRRQVLNSVAASSSWSGHRGRIETRLREARHCSTERPPNEKKDAQASSEMRFVAHVVERSLFELIGSLTLPVRHVLCLTGLRLLCLAFPGSWEPREFWQGATLAFRYVIEKFDAPMEEGLHPVEGLVGDSILKAALEASTDRLQHERELGRVQFKQLRRLRLRGLRSVRLHSEQDGTYAISVTTLFSATELYVPNKPSSEGGSAAARPPSREEEEEEEPTEAKRPAEGEGGGQEKGEEAANSRPPPRQQKLDGLLVKRLHRWTFRRALSRDVDNSPGDWQVVAMNKTRWKPPKGLLV